MRIPGGQDCKTAMRASVSALFLLLGACATSPAQTTTTPMAPDPVHSELESVGARKGVGPTTAALLDVLCVVDVEVAAITTQGRVVLAARTGNAAAVEHHLVTARRLIHPEEYEEDLAAAVIQHQAVSASIEVTARFVYASDGTVYAWPASAELGPERGLDLGPERVSPLEPRGPLQLRSGVGDMSTFRVRGRPPGRRGLRWTSNRGELVPITGDLFVVVGSTRDTGEIAHWRAVAPLSKDLRVGVPSSARRRALGAPLSRLGEGSPFAIPADVLAIVTDDQRELVVSPLVSGIVGGTMPHLQDGPSLSGRVVDRSGRPVPWATLEAYAGKRVHPDTWLESTTTAEDGTFELRRSVDGPTIVVPSDDDLAAVIADPDVTEVVVALAHDVLLAEREPPRSPAPEPWTGIRVGVRDAETLAPPPNARVTATHDGVTHELTGADGVFELRNAAPGTWLITINDGVGRSLASQLITVVKDQVAFLDVTWEGPSTRIGWSHGVPEPPPPATVGRAVTDAPATWFTLEGEVYFPGTEEKAVQALLNLEPTPRWFGLERGPPAEVRALPTTDRGARLDLRATRGAPGELVLELELHAGADGLCREVEHRSTNLVPFLFAFEADGAQVVVDSDGWEKFGGMNGFVDLVPPGKARTWSLRVRSGSLDHVVPRPFPQRLSVIAAFCEVQHDGFLTVGLPLPPIEDIGLAIQPPVLIRSEPLVLERAEDGWVPADRSR